MKTFEEFNLNESTAILKLVKDSDTVIKELMKLSNKVNALANNSQKTKVSHVVRAANEVEPAWNKFLDLLDDLEVELTNAAAELTK